MILFWPALFFIDGDDVAKNQEYAKLRGETIALVEAGKEKNCTLPNVQLPEEKAADQPDQKNSN